MLVAVDTGGTKTLIAGFDHSGDIVGSTVKFPTPKDSKTYVSLVRKTLQEKYSNEDVEALVIALPGIVKNGVAIWCSNLGWKDFEAQKAFEGLFDAPVLIENDANLAGLSETRLIDPIPESVLYVTVSTGIGTGVITNGHIDPGLRHSEAGHALVEFEGSMREWESFASGKAIYQAYGKFGHEISDPATWQQIAKRISRGFLAVIPIIQPDVVVVGGSMGTHFDKYGHLLEEILRKELSPHLLYPHFKQAEHPEKAVIHGCYYYAVDYLSSR
jgi:glucokinase